MMNELLREKFMKFLLKRPCTKRQAVAFLERQGTEEIDDLLAEAEGMGLIDDEAYSRLYISGHLSWGNRKIAYELEARGVSREVIRDALDDSDGEEERASELAENLRRSGLDERKIASRLLGRGFSNGAVRSAMNGR